MTGEPASGHDRLSHTIEGTTRQQAARVIARHLCGWITGHHAPAGHFLPDAEMIINDTDSGSTRHRSCHHPTQT